MLGLQASRAEHTVRGSPQADWKASSIFLWAHPAATRVNRGHNALVVGAFSLCLTSSQRKRFSHRGRSAGRAHERRTST